MKQVKSVCKYSDIDKLSYKRECLKAELRLFKKIREIVDERNHINPISSF